MMPRFFAALHVEATPGIRELVDLTIFIRIPIRGVGDVLTDDVGRVGKHILDVLGGQLGLVIVDNDLAPLALVPAVGSLAVPLLAGLLLGGPFLFLVTLESSDTHGGSATITGGVEAELKARVASSTGHGRSIFSIIEVEAADLIVIIWEGELSVGHHVIPVLAGEGSEVVGSGDGGSADRREAIGGHGIFGAPNKLDVGDGTLAALGSGNIVIVVEDVTVVVLLFLDEVGVGVEGTPPLVLLFLLNAGTAAIGSMVEHATQIGVESEVGRGGGRGLGTLGPVLGKEHGTAGGIATGLRIIGTIFVVVLGEDPASRGSTLTTTAVEGEGDEEGTATGGTGHAGDGNAEGGQVDHLGLVVHVHVDGLDEQTADGTGGRGLVELAEVGDVEAGPAFRLLPAAGGGVEIDEGNGLLAVLPVGTLRSGTEGHLDLDHGLLGIVHEVLDLAGVDANDAEEEMTGHTEGQGDGGVDDGLDGGVNIGGEDGRTAELLVTPVGRQPHLTQRALLGEDNLRVEHLVPVAVLLEGRLAVDRLEYYLYIVAVLVGHLDRDLIGWGWTLLFGCSWRYDVLEYLGMRLKIAWRGMRMEEM